MVPAISVLVEVDPLPCTERGSTTADRDGQTGRGQCGANVRRHVVGALAGVAKDRITRWDHSSEEPLEVALHFGVRVFLNDQRGGRVAHVKRQQPFTDSRFSNPADDLVGELVEVPPARVDDELLNLLSNGVVLPEARFNLTGGVCDSRGRTRRSPWCDR